MQSATRIRFASIIILIFILAFWFFPSYLVWLDYQRILDRANVVTLSIISLWLPIGGAGAVFVVLALLPKAIILGKGMNEIYSPRTMQIANKICVYFALAGVAFVFGWTYHSLDLLDKYGYEYSYQLTKITPTGIHLAYVRTGLSHFNRPTISENTLSFRDFN